MPSPTNGTAPGARAPLTGPVRVVGAGLLGTSVGLALRRAGLEVHLADVVPENARIAAALGAGTATAPEAAPQLVVVAVPPDHLATEIVTALEDTAAVVTDVGSVKSAPLQQVRARVSAGVLGRYVGGHPLAGSERSGPLAGSAALFDGRPWAVTPHPHASREAAAVVTALAETCGAVPIRYTPEQHDLAVARTSHLPHLLAALAAGRLADAPARDLALSGQGVRDVTRIAAGDPEMWQQIVAANAQALFGLLREVRDDLGVLLRAVEHGSRDDVAALLARGVAGTGAIPAKHGGPPQAMAALFVVVPDAPGELARLLADAGAAAVNIEDLRIDHDPGRPTGTVELTVAAERIEHLEQSLAARGWTTHR